jgi:hypothetical protein
MLGDESSAGSQAASPKKPEEDLVNVNMIVEKIGELRAASDTAQLPAQAMLISSSSWA